MAIRYVGDGVYRGLSTDTKPTTGLATDSMMLEEDTRNIFIFDGSSWSGMLTNNIPKKYIVYRTAGGTVKAYNTDNGSVQYTNNNYIDPVLNSIFTNNIYTTVEVSDTLSSSADYFIDPSGTGIKPSQGSELLMTRNVRLHVPNGFASNVIDLSSTTTGQSDTTNIRYNTVKGGFILEDGTPQRLWTGIRLRTNQAFRGLFSTHILNTKIFDPGIGIQLLNNSNNSYINGNAIRDVTVLTPVICCEFIHATDANISNNTFDNLIMQSGDETTHGVKDVCTSNNMFLGCKMWDINLGVVGAKTLTIHNASRRTLIFGGIMSNAMEDNSALQDTIIIDTQQTKLPNPFLPSQRKWGFHSGVGPTSGQGMFSSNFTPLTGNSNGSPDISTTQGRYSRYSTAGTTASRCGFRYLQGNLTMRDLNPIFRLNVRLQSTSALRTFFGLYDDVTTAEPTGDDFLNAKAGIMLYARSTDTNFHLGSNDNTATATEFTDLGSAIDTSNHFLELRARGGNWYYKWDGGVLTQITTRTPGAGDKLGVVCGIETSEDVVKTFDLYYMELVTDK